MLKSKRVFLEGKIICNDKTVKNTKIFNEIPSAVESVLGS